ncbi:1-aminocyclopropane-1-carboxylate deaminase/D-cysteine desulfhydrase [candidate division KSB1 bacterium]
MKRPEKLSLALLPTPIHKLEKLSRILNKNIYIKRDDLTGMQLSGNKIRKLEYILKQALNENTDVVVTCGGIQSNHARATVSAAKQIGLNAFAVLRGTPPDIYEGNTFIMSALGAGFRYVTQEEYDNIDETYGELDKEFQSKGQKAYFIPEGASNHLGCWGYIENMEEIARQENELSIKFDDIFVATGSAGTYAGLLLGKYMTTSNADIHGFNIYSKSRDFSEVIKGLCCEAIEIYNIPAEFNPDDIRINNDYLGEGYAITDDDQLSKILSFADLEGILLDHVYTGKAYIGMSEMLTRNPEKFGDNILFMHTGGLFGVFPIRDKISRLLKGNKSI